MPNEIQDSFEQRIDRLRKELRVYRGASVLVVGLLALMVQPTIRSERARAEDSGKVLHLRGLIIEDQHGRSRILIGAPVPNEGRKRQDEATGLIVLSENGSDRVSIGYTPSPQIQGEVSQRIAPAVGIYLHDPEGNERGGLGYLDLGKNKDRVVLGLDRATGEGIVASVDDEDGSAVLNLNYLKPAEGIQGTMAGVSAATVGSDAFLVLVDKKGKERARLGMKDGSPELKLFDAKGKLVADLFGRAKR